MAERHERKAAIDFGFLTGKVKLATEEENSHSAWAHLVHLRHNTPKDTDVENQCPIADSCYTHSYQRRQLMGHGHFYSFVVT